MKITKTSNRCTVWYHPVHDKIDVLDEQCSNVLEFVDVQDARMSAQFMGWIEIGEL